MKSVATYMIVVFMALAVFSAGSASAHRPSQRELSDFVRGAARMAPEADYFNPARQFVVAFADEPALHLRQLQRQPESPHADFSPDQWAQLLQSHLDSNAAPWMDSLAAQYTPLSAVSGAAKRNFDDSDDSDKSDDDQWLPYQPLQVEYVRRMEFLDDRHIFRIADQSGFGNGLDMAAILATLESHPDVAHIEEDRWVVPFGFYEEVDLGNGDQKTTMLTMTPGSTL